MTVSTYAAGVLSGAPTGISSEACSAALVLLTVAAWAGTALKAAPANMATATSDRVAPSLRGSRRRLIGGSELQSMQGVVAIRATHSYSGSRLQIRTVT